MKTDLLLPYRFKRIGWAILIPAGLLGLMMLLDGFNGVPTYLYPNDGSAICSALNSTLATRIANNVALIGVLVGALFVACSRERVEDEYISRIRLNALLAALYVNTAIVVVAALAVYDLSFLNMMVYNLFTLPLLFVALFRYRLWRLRKEVRDEE